MGILKLRNLKLKLRQEREKKKRIEEEEKKKEEETLLSLFLSEVEDCEHVLDFVIKFVINLYL